MMSNKEVQAADSRRRELASTRYDGQAFVYAVFALVCVVLGILMGIGGSVSQAVIDVLVGLAFVFVAAVTYRR